MKDYIEATEMFDGKVLKLHPRNGGWGVDHLSTFPDLPKIKEDGNAHTWYILGIPDVIVWVGNEYGRSGVGLALRRGESYLSFYDDGYREGINFGPEKLKELGLERFFSLSVRASRGEIQISATEFSSEVYISLESLASGQGKGLTDEEKRALKALAALL